MSNIYKKIQYVTQGPYGSTEYKNLYVHFQNSNDFIRVLEEDGNVLFSYNEWGVGDELDLGQAIIKVLTGNNNDLECLTEEEMKKIFKNKI